MEEKKLKKYIHTVLNLVHDINSKGGKLAFDFRPGAIDIFDIGNGCESIIPNWAHRIYWNDRWNDKTEEMFKGTIKVLKERLEKLSAF